ncbi:MAG: hypothetical protein H7X71_07845 [Chitinophagales bacterium]|nr:hypothetical protein [Chitinophagales bacterium]
MTGEQQLDVIKTNLERLLRNYTALKNENEILKNQVEAQRRTAGDKNKKITELEEQLTLLKTVKAITDSDPLEKEEKTNVKHRINELIKEVDKCIALLNN